MSLAPEEIGRRLATARKLRGWTQLQFALEANVSPSSVARWEAGKLPPIRELVRLSRLLEIEPATLVEDSYQPDVGDLRREVAELRGQVDEVLSLLRHAHEGRERPQEA